MGSCRKLLAATVIFLSLTAVGIGLWLGPRALAAVLLLQDIAAGPGSSSLKSWTAEPEVTRIAWQDGAGSASADLYRGSAVRGAIVLVPGADRRGRDDPRLTSLARSLARSGFLVLVPDLQNLRQLLVRPADAGAIAAAVRKLSAEPETAGRPLGIAAISYALAPAVLAALEPEVRERIDFIFGLGGFYASTPVVRFFTTGAFRLSGERSWRHSEPNAYGKWLFVRANAAVIDDPADRTTLEAMAGRRLEHADAPIDDLAALLGPTGRSVYDLVENHDPERVPDLIARLPASIRDEMAALSPASHDLSRLHAALILVHGRNDAIVPFSESVALAAAAPRAELFLLDDLAHVDLKPSGWYDALTLWHAAFTLVGYLR
jgi:hypothetical protein